MILSDLPPYLRRAIEEYQVERDQVGGLEPKRSNTRKGKIKARFAVYRAVRRNKLKKPSQCSKCKAETLPRKLHGHHVDYGQPLEIVWLCLKCHREEHRKPPKEPRPPRVPQPAKSRIVAVRISEQLYNEISGSAQQVGQTVSDFVRSRILQ